ncbi:MAG: M10 family metallopeptidase [Maritimibacter sp.]|nr:M10 family metallopeptidase [Maritimibacter sp.]
MTVKNQILVNTIDGRYGYFNTRTEAFEYLGSFGTQLTDVSYSDNGNLYGIDFGELYLLDPDDGSATWIADLPVSDANGFLMLGDDTAIVTTLRGDWIEFNVITGEIEVQVTMPNSVYSAGDISVFVNDYGGFDYAISVINTSGETELLRYTYDRTGYTGHILDTLPLDNVFGLAWAGADTNNLFLFAGSTAYGIDYDAIQYVELVDLADSGFGAVAGATDVKLAPYYQDLANYLTWGYWADTGRTARAFVEDTITVNVSAMNGSQKALIQAALDAWEDVADVAFTITTSAGADIRFQRDSTQNTQTWTYPVSGTGGAIDYARINIDAARYSNWDIGDNAYFDIMHEIGHALGLGHAGDYNFTLSDAGILFDYDGQDVSIMSYVDPSTNSDTDADWGDSNGTYPLTPMLADIFAARILYGTADPVRTGNTTYGHNTNLKDARWQIDDMGRKFAMTIVDDGGRDTLDFSGFRQDQVLNLTGGSFSSVGGNTNNLAIMLDTVIENAVGGTGDDTLWGNAAANRLQGGEGNDDLYGATGADTLIGGRDKDMLSGQNGRDVLSGGKGRDILKGGVGNDRLEGGNGIDRFVFKTGWDVDTITDFDARGLIHDRIDLSGLGSVTGWSDLKNNHLERDGGDVVIDGKHGDQLVLVDVRLGDLDKGDFIF